MGHNNITLYISTTAIQITITLLSAKYMMEEGLVIDKLPY